MLVGATYNLAYQKTWSKLENPKHILNKLQIDFLDFGFYFEIEDLDII